jgi:hypothetical protein
MRTQLISISMPTHPLIHPSYPIKRPEDVNSCGDWLAVALKDAFRTDEGGFNLTAFNACLKENGVTPPNVDMDRHGAIGRFRMCAGLMLRRHASKVGHVIIGEKKIAAPVTKRRGRKTKAARAEEP